MTALHEAIDHQLTVIAERLNLAASRLPEPPRPGDRRACTDDFLVATTQHLTAVIEVVLPAVRRHLPDGRAAARDYVLTAKRLERALVMAKAKQYGQAQNVGRAWSQVWGAVRYDLVTVTQMERALASRLADVLGEAETEDLGGRLAATVRRSPTRPHPHLPHRGIAGRVARGVWGRADRVWDEFEGRVARPFSAR